MVLKTLGDFAVEECVTHHFEKDGKWFWYCLTCHTGSGKRHEHLRGHKREGDAAVGAKYHRNAKRVIRQEKLYRAWWWKEVMTTQDLDYFLRLWQTHWGVLPPPEDPDDLMASVQSDNYLWNFMVKLQTKWTSTTN